MSQPLTSVNPASGETIQQYAQHTDAEVDARLGQAVARQQAWARESARHRAGLLAQVANQLAKQKEALAGRITREMGKLPAEASGEIEKCAWVCRYYAEHGEDFLADESLEDDDDKRSFVSHEPLGVILAVMPWNFPFWQVFRCAIPALLAGNAVVLKHASNVSGCALDIEAVFNQAGLPDGLFATLLISGERASALLDDTRVAGASVTGSERAGASVAARAGKHIKPSVLELGGSDPFVVLDLEDRENIIGNAVQSRFMNCGQSCIAAKRFIVLDAVCEPFMEAFCGEAEKLVPGHKLAPMARDDLRDTLHAQVEDARANGAKIVMGGEMPSGDGYYYPPTVVTGISPACRIYGEEVFGPVASIYRATDAEDALRIANDTPYGLGGSIWCQDTERAITLARRVRSGAVYVNRMMASDPRLPFGGIGISGYGRELSRAGVLEFLNRKTISVKC